jgi:hypothetical protein
VNTGLRVGLKWYSTCLASTRPESKFPYCQKKKKSVDHATTFHLFKIQEQAKLILDSRNQKNGFTGKRH